MRFIKKLVTWIVVTVVMIAVLAWLLKALDAGNWKLSFRTPTTAPTAAPTAATPPAPPRQLPVEDPSHRAWTPTTATTPATPPLTRAEVEGMIAKRPMVSEVTNINVTSNNTASGPYSHAETTLIVNTGGGSGASKATGGASTDLALERQIDVARGRLASAGDEFRQAYYGRQPPKVYQSIGEKVRRLELELQQLQAKRGRT